MSDLQDQLDELQSAEDFFDFFKVPFEARVMAAQRLRIMQRLRCVLREVGAAESSAREGVVDEMALAEIYRSSLTQIYEECREGTGPALRKEQPSEPDQSAAATQFVPITAIRGARRRRGG